MYCIVLNKIREHTLRMLTPLCGDFMRIVWWINILLVVILDIVPNWQTMGHYVKRLNTAATQVVVIQMFWF